MSASLRSRLLLRGLPPIFAVVLTAAVLVALTGSAAASSTPVVSVSKSVSGTTATITYSINRAPNQIAGRSCSLAGPTTSTACGLQTASTKTSTSYQVGLTNLSPGNYTYSVKFTLTDGGKGSGSTTFTINKLSQSISFTSTNPSPVTVGGPSYSPSATASSGLPVAISLDATSTGCSLSAGVVSFTGAGTCKVDANQGGNSTYNAAAQQQQSITVNKKSQTISF